MNWKFWTKKPVTANKEPFRLVIEQDLPVVHFSEPLPAAIDPDDFRAYLAAMKPREVVGQRGNGYLCPLARYLSKDEEMRFFVTSAFIEDLKSKTCLFPPQWVVDFVEAIDARSNQYKTVTAMTALKTLNQVAPEGAAVAAE